MYVADGMFASQALNEVQVPLQHDVYVAALKCAEDTVTKSIFEENDEGDAETSDVATSKPKAS
jgi:hypothetical protein